MSEEFKQLMANLKDILICADLEYHEREDIQSIEYQILEYVEAVEAASVKDGLTAIAWYQRAKELEMENNRLREALNLIYMVAGNTMNPEADKAVIRGIVNDVIHLDI